jgi:hypothetical protein
MGLFSFTRNKVKSRIRETIYRSSDQIEQVERDLVSAQNELAEMRERPGIERWVLALMENNLAGMAANLKELKAAHARYVAEQKKPSIGFPKGVSV